MNKCTPADKPLISILMAIYEPNLHWLRLQLSSLNAQTYPNLRLYIREDCSPTVPYRAVCACVKDCITTFPYSISRNEKNLGSNNTFELLTAEAKGTYFAYCDQDDVWLPEKIFIMQKALETESALLACSDMYIIDGTGKQIATSVTAVRRHHTFHSGDGLAGSLLFSNFVTGCTILVDSVQAKAAIPFCPYMIHDHYLALFCAERGKLLSLPQPLIHYRIHGANQTGILSGVTDKVTYERMRMDQPLQRLRWLKDFFPCTDETKQQIQQGILWLQARKDSWNRQGSGFALLTLCHSAWLITAGELVLKYVPNRVFMKVVEWIRENRL